MNAHVDLKKVTDAMDFKFHIHYTQLNNINQKLFLDHRYIQPTLENFSLFGRRLSDALFAKTPSIINSGNGNTLTYFLLIDNYYSVCHLGAFY